MLVYIAINRINDKRYIGITKGTLRRRWQGHLQMVRKGAVSALYAAIRKYGADAFEVFELTRANDLESLCALEIRFIYLMNTKAPRGYNMTDGGEGVRGMDSASIERRAAKIRGRKHTPEALILIGAASRGRKKSAETKAKIGAVHRGRILTEEHRHKLALAKLGTKPKRSAEHIARLHEGRNRYNQQRKEQAHVRDQAASAV